VTRELLLPLVLAKPGDCPGSRVPPRRNWRGRAECAVCRKRFAIKLDGTVRTHPEKPKFLPVKGIDIPDCVG